MEEIEGFDVLIPSFSLLAISFFDDGRISKFGNDILLLVN